MSRDVQITEQSDSSDPRPIPKAVVKRLSLYNRILQQLEYEGVDKVSSADLARRLGLNSAQVRKDFACFGQFGVPGFGYHVSELKREIRRILGTDREVSVILVGVGLLGSALLSYGGFIKQGFTMVWGFDTDPNAAQSRARSSVPVFAVSELETHLRTRAIDVAVLAVPREVAQSIADRLVALGVTAILNFVPMRLSVPEHVHVQYVDLSLELENLSYYVR